MQNKIEITQKPATNYKEKYEQLKELLNTLYQYLEATYKTSPETLLINASVLDAKLDKKEINYKQAYFNLLNTCYEKVKNNSLCVLLKLDPEQITKLSSTQIASDIILRKELPKEVKKEEENISILTPEGLYQYDPHYEALASDKKQQVKVLFKQILTKEELKEIGFQDYLAKAEKASSEANTSIKAELIKNELIYDLDEAIKKKNDASAQMFGRNVNKFHTVFLVTASDHARRQLLEKAEASKPKKDNISVSEELHDMWDLLASLNKPALREGLQAPAPKGANGLIQLLCSFKNDIYDQLDFKDRFLIELMDSINFLGEEKIKSYRAKIKSDTNFERDVKNLIQEIIIDVYNHGRANPADKEQCYSIVNKYLVAKDGYDKYENDKGHLDIPVTKEQHIEYTMDQWIKNRQSGIDNPSLYDHMISLLKARTNELSDFKYNPKQNSTALSKESNVFPFIHIEDEEERSYFRINPSKVSTEFNELLSKQNPVIVKALHEKYEDSKTTPEIKAKLRQFILKLDQFEAEVNKLQLQADLFKDTHIAKSIKSSYCNTLKSNVETTKATLMQQHDELKAQIEEIFAEEIKAGKTLKIIGAVLMVLGAAITLVGIALAVFIAPLSGLVAVPGVAALATGVGLFKKGSNSINIQAEQIISDVYKQGEGAIKSIETQENIEEPKVIPQDNKPTNIF